ncbi:MAG: sigma-70 family RNA polymerase sigma factor [Planctomycetes bacterium]|nr:sigma-70 family RNA polymerase sigma factor [Planctomycetota bacterium]
MPVATREGPASGRAAAPAETPAQIIEDWRQYKATGSLAARNRLVAHLMRTHVRPIAARIHAGLPAQVDVDDLVQQGYLGLIDAMDRYELDREVRFETFSRQRIHGAIQDYLRSIDPVPRLTRTRYKRLQRIDERFRKEHGRAPTDDELRPLLDLPEETFERFVSSPRPAAIVPFSSVSSDNRSTPGPESDAMDVFEDRHQPGPAVHVAKRDLQRWLVRGFDRRDRLIVVLYYYEQMTMLEIGRTLGISESRVSQRLDSILKCLRSRLIGAEAAQEFGF